MPLRRSLLIVALLAALGVPTPVDAWQPSAQTVSTETVSVDGLPVRPEEGQVIRLYASALGRPAEAGGQQFWINRLIEGQTLASVAAFFVNSEEFEQRFEASDDGSFLEVVYQNVLGRPPDSNGRVYWLDRLAGGLSREHLVLHFSESPEFIEKTGTALPALVPFDSVVVPVTADDLGVSWRDGCPVGPQDLRLLTVSYLGFDGSVGSGELVVHHEVVEDVRGVFRQLYEARYPIEQMQTIDRFDGDDDASMAVNNTSAFNCRPITGGTRWSNHAYGRAVDINPRYNPYHRGSVVLPPDGEQFLDRSRYHPAFIREGDVVTRAFDAIGWRWGGRWTSLVDYQHFDQP